MQKKEIEYILSAIKAPLTHPLFYPRVFALVAKQREKKGGQDPIFRVVTEEYDELSRRNDRSQVQESTAVRNVLRTRKLAQLLIDEKGDIQHQLLPPLIKYLKSHLYSLGPQRQYDSQRQEHILKVLQLLDFDKELSRMLKKLTRPLMNKWAEDLIRQTLQLSPQTMVTDAHTRQAVLAAWLCYLRQNVGSCFATAPAEIVHDEQPELFLQDMLDLVATGMLKRTFGGIENAVPLSASWGSGDLKKPIFLQISSTGIFPEIWYSPGLMQAFETIGILDVNDSNKEKIHQLEEWIKPVIFQKASHSFCVLNIEEIIRMILLRSQGITESQIKEYENRPRTIVQPHLFVYPSSISKGLGGLGERCDHFFSLFETSKNVFKSLSDNAFLKAWEFTLASFSDTKYEFARWNFYASLGLQTNEPGGIGQCIYQTIQNKLDQANQKVQEIQYEYEMVYAQVKTLESRMNNASTEKELHWLKIEYQSKKNEFYFLEEQRNNGQNQSLALVNLYDILYKLYVDLFKDYFQEVYDADMQEVTTGPFDDSPAGFRLLYKHGRSNTSQWTRIKNPNEFIDALASFFVATEPQIAHALDGKKIEKDLSDVVTAIINHVRTKEFLETAFHRMAIAHKVSPVRDPLDHLDLIEKKPWVYTSGGTMNTLVSCYYRIEDRPKEVEKWIESEMELLVYLCDTVKQIPPVFLDPFMKEKKQSLLMQSPTHAFLFKPMLSPFKEAWMNEEFTYTYLRDRFVRPMEMFVEKMLLDSNMINYLIQKISEKVPENFQPQFQSIFRRIEGPLNPIFFREYVANQIEQNRGLRYGAGSIISIDEIDRLLYSSLPFFSIDELRNRIKQILSKLPSISSERMMHIMQIFDQIPFSRAEFSILGAQHLQEITKALLCLSSVETSTSIDYSLQIYLAAQSLGFAMPRPLIFADTNWVKDLFGFTVNPGTGKLELWRFDYTGSVGAPMSSWKQWVNGTRPDSKWGIYVKPYEYGQV